MKSSVEKTNTSATFEIEFESKDFEPARIKALERLARDVKVAGFREGKAPANVVEQHVDPNQLSSQTLDILIRQTIPKVFGDEDIIPISVPRVDVMSYVPGESAKVKITADIMPEVEFCDYADLQAEYIKQTIKDADIEDVLNRIADSFAESAVVKRAAKDGDEVIIDFVGKKDGEAFQGGSAKDYTLKLGSGQFIPGFEDGIVGHEVGDSFDLNLTFPEDYGNKSLAGEAVVFEVLLKQVNEVKSPAIDDELAKKTGAFEKLSDLKEDIRKNLEEQAQRQADERYKDALLQALVSGSKTEAPKGLVQEQVENFRGEILRNLKARKQDLSDWLEAQGKTKEDWEKELEDAAERRVISSIVVQRLGEKLNIEVEEKLVEAQLEQMRRAYGKSAEALKQLDTPETKLNIRNRMRINAIMDKLVELNRPHAKEVELGEAKPKKAAKKSDKKDSKKAAKKAK
jgi:trigger factor